LAGEMTMLLVFLSQQFPPLSRAAIGQFAGINLKKNFSFLVRFLAFVVCKKTLAKLMCTLDVKKVPHYLRNQPMSTFIS
jgi:hypothetical protein